MGVALTGGHLGAWPHLCVGPLGAAVPGLSLPGGLQGWRGAPGQEGALLMPLARPRDSFLSRAFFSQAPEVALATGRSRAA